MSYPPMVTGKLLSMIPSLIFRPDTHRSPSPPPQYDNHGRRINTREYRYRKRLEDERHKLIEKAMKTIPNYHAPQDYRRPTKTQEKVYVPVNDYPEINFSMIANSLLTLHNNPCCSHPSASGVRSISGGVACAELLDPPRWIFPNLSTYI